MGERLLVHYYDIELWADFTDTLFQLHFMRLQAVKGETSVSQRRIIKRLDLEFKDKQVFNLLLPLKVLVLQTELFDACFKERYFLLHSFCGQVFLFEL